MDRKEKNILVLSTYKCKMIMNRKLLKFTSILLVAMCLCMNFTACGGDDDDENHKSNGTEQTEEKDDNNTDENTDNKTEEKPATGIENGHTWVDLGLPSGVKWATCNVGAENPWEYGDYFMWGETVPYGKEDYSNIRNYAYNLDNYNNNISNCYIKTFDPSNSWSTYKYCYGSGYNPQLTKYNTKSNYGVMDNRYTLHSEDDAAYVNWGGCWRMPTKEEQDELRNNCYWERSNMYNGKEVNGYIVYKAKNTSDKGKVYSGGAVTTMSNYSLTDTHIFLPIKWSINLPEVKYSGDLSHCYWSSSLSNDDPHDAYSMCSKYLPDIGTTRRFDFLYVRGVCK